MKKVAAVLVAFALILTVSVYRVHGQAVNQGLSTILTGVDACGGNADAKTSFSTPSRALITTATTTLLVAAPGAAVQSTNICGVYVSTGSTTTANTWQFEYGTQVTNPCDTGTTTLTPALNTTGVLAGHFVTGFAENTVFALPAGKQFCVVSTVGSTPNIAVWGTAVTK